MMPFSVHPFVYYPTPNELFLWSWGMRLVYDGLPNSFSELLEEN